MTDSVESGQVPLRRFWHPRYWWMWVLVVILRVLCLLPFRAQMFLGRMLGRLSYHLVPSRRRTAHINLKLCFPEMSEERRRELLIQNFESLGMGIFDIGLSWWASDERAGRLTKLKGLEHIKAAQQTGRGIVLLSGHFAGTELTGRRVGLEIDAAALYRPTKNKLADQFLRRGRMRSVASGLIPKDAMRQMIRLLRNGGIIWYASDQSYARKYHELVPFFGEPAMTNAALTQIARISNALVVPYVPRRRDDFSGYDAEFFPPLTDFPSDDAAADATRINVLLEEHIRRAPEQYLWIHRRFKNRPAGFADPYQKPITP